MIWGIPLLISFMFTDDIVLSSVTIVKCETLRLVRGACKMIHGDKQLFVVQLR